MIRRPFRLRASRGERAPCESQLENSPVRTLVRAPTSVNGDYWFENDHFAFSAR